MSRRKNINDFEMSKVPSIECDFQSLSRDFLFVPRKNFGIKGKVNCRGITFAKTEISPGKCSLA